MPAKQLGTKATGEEANSWLHLVHAWLEADYSEAPPKLHRQAAMHYLAGLDHALSQAGCKGLASFVFEEEEQEKALAGDTIFRCPNILALGQDQGSIGFSA